MAKIIRIRCPVCGMLVTQKQLDDDHEFEFKIQIIGSRGRGKIYHIYREPDKVEGKAFLMFKLVLAEKLRAVADRLVESVQFPGKKKPKAVEVDADYEAIIPGYTIDPVTVYDAPALTETRPAEVTEILPGLLGEATPEPITETTPQTVMEGEHRWQGSAGLDAKTVLEVIPRTVLEN